MAELIGIACGHGEQVVPDNSEYNLFFELLRSQGRRTEAIDGQITEDRLAGVSALLIGEPHAGLEAPEIEAIRRWVQGGGHLLVLSTMGGDSAPGCVEPTYGVNLSDLLPFVDFLDCVLAVDKGIREGRPFDTRVAVDISSLIGQRATLCYDSGTVLDIHADDMPKSRPPVSGPTRSLGPPPGASMITLRLDDGQAMASEFPYDLDEASLLASFRDKDGEITCFGASWSFKDDTLIQDDNLLFAGWLLHQWLPRLTEQELVRRLRSPQRHRLLHGYPMAPLMRQRQPLDPRGTAQLDELASAIAPAPDRSLLIGVLPHPYCNPKVKGCGFCTFPHEVFQRDAARATTSAVAREVAITTAAHPQLQNRAVEAVYIGGGTANLAPAEELAEVCSALAGRFDLGGAEVTLEGVPIYFLTNDLARILAEKLGTSRLRLSMGIQTFAPAQLRRMGRSAFGDARTVARAVARAHLDGYTISGDLLFNLPGQTRAEMAADVDQAMMLGLDQICLYHLVLFDGLGTEWSRDPDLLAALPSNPEACDAFLELRDRLLAGGYRQRTLTNFERAEHAGTPREFIYEQRVFCPESHDWLGFGPAAISMFGGAGFQRALKLQNPDRAAEYTAALAPGRPPWQKLFAFSPHDMKILYVTRKIAALGFQRAAYRDLFGTDVADDFPRETDVLVAAGLIEMDHLRWALTPHGMFYADTVAGLFAWRQVDHLRTLDRTRGRVPAGERLYHGRYVDQTHWMG